MTIIVDFISLCLFIQLLWLKNHACKLCITTVNTITKLLNLSFRKNLFVECWTIAEYSQIVLDSILTLGNFKHRTKLFVANFIVRIYIYEKPHTPPCLDIVKILMSFLVFNISMYTWTNSWRLCCRSFCLSERYINRK